MNIQGRGQVLGWGQQNNKNYTNRALIYKSSMKIKPCSSFKTQMSTVELYPHNVGIKQKSVKYKTQQNSPINQRLNSINTLHFPELFIDSNSQYKKQIHPKEKGFNAQKSVSKTVAVMDSLMKLLKEQSIPQKMHQNKYFLLRESSNQFAQLQKIKRQKRPKLVKNEITKKFFEKPNKQRKIQSQDKMRINKSDLFSETIHQYTFYGGNFHNLKVQTEIGKQTKNQLNLLRINKMRNIKI